MNSVTRVTCGGESRQTAVGVRGAGTYGLATESALVEGALESTDSCCGVLDRPAQKLADKSAVEGDRLRALRRCLPLET